ncbi:glutamate-rich protein 2 [Chelmon rostratus]|uniref:glutamate-rich protein 2 n=1 Tax=Chelmon rostratus TaxID=109905 RepID=UPI001BEA7924|nr:glutamate-rich protein 2 [Chelmon rostratus]
MKAQPPDSAVTAEPLSTHEPNGDEEQSEKEDVEDEDLKAPVELIIEFLRAVMDRDFQLASKLCQMILIYEPDNPEASEFLPLIQKKLLEVVSWHPTGEVAPPAVCLDEPTPTRMETF